MVEPNKLESSYAIMQKHWRKTSLTAKPFYKRTEIDQRDYHVCDFCKGPDPIMQIVKDGRYRGWWICWQCNADLVQSIMDGEKNISL